MSTPPARVTVVESIYYQSTEQQPVAVDSRYSYSVLQDEQPFCRKLVVKGEWQELDTGWIEKCSLLSLAFDPPALQTNPTEHVRKEIESRTVEVGIRFDSSSEPIAFAILRPGESLRIRPTCVDRYFVRSKTTDCRCSLCLLPE